MARTYTQLTVIDRNRIQVLLEAGKTLAFIARAIGRHKSTISRETTRNVSSNFYYQAASAQTQTTYRRWVASSKSRVDLKLLKKAFKKLTEFHWSPEQISNRMKLECGRTISASSLYKHIWLDKLAHGVLHRYLRISCRYRYKRNVPLRVKGF